MIGGAHSILYGADPEADRAFRFEPRIAWLEPLFAVVFRPFLWRRHRKLRRLFGSD